MANTFYQLYIQSVFAVKYRDAVLKPQWRNDFFGIIGNLINETGCKNIIVKGVEDHVHCFFGLIPGISISDVMKKVKANSSRWLNEQHFLNHRFEWQSGYGAFSYSRSHVDDVFQYIRNQDVHHQKKSFKEEYVEMLRSFSIEYDERYLFQELI
jgi:putative transposase